MIVDGKRVMLCRGFQEEAPKVRCANVTSDIRGSASREFWVIDDPLWTTIRVYDDVYHFCSLACLKRYGQRWSRIVKRGYIITPVDTLDLWNEDVA